MILNILLEPIDTIFNGDAIDILFYITIQVIVLLITHILSKRGCIAFNLPVVHYTLGLVFGHIIYAVTVVLVIAHTGIIP